MRLLLVTVFLISILLTSVAITSAQTEIPKPTPKATSDVVLKEVVKEGAQYNKANVPAKVVDLQAKIASKEAVLKQKLATFKDKTKAKTVEKISLSLNQINANWLEQANEFLANVTRILDRLEERVNEKKTSGQDTTQASAAIADARAKIASASAAVASQSEMDYTLIITSELQAKIETNRIRDRFQNDWQAVRQLLRDTKQAVAQTISIAATTLGGIGGGTKK